MFCSSVVGQLPEQHEPAAVVSLAPTLGPRPRQKRKSVECQFKLKGFKVEMLSRKRTVEVCKMSSIVWHFWNKRFDSFHEISLKVERKFEYFRSSLWRRGLFVWRNILQLQSQRFETFNLKKLNSKFLWFQRRQVAALEEKMRRFDTLEENRLKNKSVLRSCDEIHAFDPSKASGHYRIDPDGALIGDDPFRVHCNMSTGEFA